MKADLKSILENTTVNGHCKIWNGYIDRDGYARISDENPLVHRIVYALAVGPIPNGFHVDHICFNPACINPDHLRALQPEVNSALQRSSFKTHCKNGHEFTSENTYYRTDNCDGKRNCRKCNADAQARLKKRKEIKAA